MAVATTAMRCSTAASVGCAATAAVEARQCMFAATAVVWSSYDVAVTIMGFVALEVVERL